MTDMKIALQIEPILLDTKPVDNLQIEGDLVEAKVVHKDATSTTVLIQNQEIVMDAEVGVVEEVGELATFEVSHPTKTQLMLKYIKPTRPITNRSISDEIKQTQPLKIPKDMDGLLEKAIRKMDVSDVLKVKEDMAQLQQHVQQLVDQLTASDLDFMVKEGLNPEKITIDVMANLVKHHKEVVREPNPIRMSQFLAEEVEKIRQRYEPVERIEAIVTALKENDVPVTKRHVDQMLTIMEKVADIKAVEPDKALNLLALKQLPTIENVYKQLHLPELDQKSLLVTEAELDGMMKQFLLKQDLPLNEDTIQAGKKLIQHELPVTKSNIEFVMEPHKVLQLIDEEQIIDEAAKRIYHHKNLKDILLTPLLEHVDLETVEGRKEVVVKDPVVVSADRVQTLTVILDQVQTIEAKHILEVVVKEDPIDLSALLKQALLDHRVSMPSTSETTSKLPSPPSMDKVHLQLFPKLQHQVELLNRALETQKVDKVLVKDIMKEVDQLEIRPSSKNVEIETLPIKVVEDLVRTHRLVEEIRLNMTLKAAIRLESQGIKIDTEPLEKVVEALRKDEVERADQQLKSSVEAQPNTLKESSDLSLLIQAKSAIEVAKIISPNVVAKIMQQHLPTTLKTIQTIHEEETHEALKETVKAYVTSKATQGYEAAETKVRPDLGDRIEKTFDQIIPVLQELDLPETPSNIKAVEILARNEMPITEENILQIQMVHEKIDYVIHQLKPMVATKLIQAGINPIELDLDEMIGLVKVFQVEMGETEEEKVGRLILDLFERNDLSQEVKESIMGIYRTFDTVLRSKGSATGFIVKNELPLTIHQLFEAAKYIRKTKGLKPSITADIDDSFGKLEALVREEKSIKEMVSSGIGHQLVNVHEASEVANLGMKSETPEEKLAKELVTIRVSGFLQEVDQMRMAMLVDKDKHEQGASQPNRLSDYNTLPLEEITKILKTWPKEERPISESQVQESYLKVLRQSPEVVKYFVDHQLPLTMQNFQRAMTMNQEPFQLIKHIEQLLRDVNQPQLQEVIVEKVKEVSETILSGKVSYDVLTETLKEIEALLVAQEKPVSEEVHKSLESVKGTLQHTQLIRMSEDYYQIPIYLNAKWSQLNMYLIGEEENQHQLNGTLQVIMSFDTAHMGRVQALLKIDGNQTQVIMQSEYEEDRSILKAFEAEIKQVMDGSNYQLMNIVYESLETKDPTSIKQAEGIVGGSREQVVENGHIDWVV